MSHFRRVVRRFGRLSVAAFLLAAASAIADVAADRALAVAAEVQRQPPAILLTWPAAADATEFRIARKPVEAAAWGADVILPGNATQYSDTSVAPGVAYEYSVIKIASDYTAPGFLCAGIEVPLVEDRGSILLVVEETHATALAAEIARLRQDLVGDGWKVLRRDVARAASPLHVKELIRRAYFSDRRLRSVFLLGHVPVPYSGNLAPDAHVEHKGAWPADAFYGDLDGGWTDTTANISTAVESRNHNVPGDGKYDQSTIPSDLELEIGRVDMADLPAFAMSEVELLRRYLEKDHAFRHRSFVVERRGLIVDGFGIVSGEAFAANAWGNFWSLFGAAAVAEEPWFATLSSQSRLWAYACGTGTFVSVGAMDVTQFAGTESHAVFTAMFGSYFGDWDHADSLLRAPLANAGTGLAAIWAGRPFWYLHPMGMGRTLGACARMTQYNLTLYPSNSAARGVHVALMGDPTLRLHPVGPPSNLVAERRSARVVDLTWSASAEAVAGYHIYRGVEPGGTFSRISKSLVQATSFTDTAAESGASYMVRAVKLEQTPTGTYWNASQGVFGTADAPRVSLRVKRAVTSALGGGPAEIVFTRSGSDLAPLDVRYRLGGTARNGVHFEPLNGLVTIPAGVSRTTIEIVPKPDTGVTPTRSVIVTLAPDAAYSVSRAHHLGTVTITSGTLAFAPYAGRYADVAVPGVTEPTRLSLWLGANGAFTATIRSGTELFRIRGALDAGGGFSGPVQGNPDVIFSLSLAFEDGVPMLIGSLIREGDPIADFTASRAFAPPVELVVPGLYTVALRATARQPGASIPDGTGWGLARIGRDGCGRVIFVLGDGTRASAGIVISEDGSWPVFVPLYRSTGWLGGTGTFQDVTNVSDAAGDLSWWKPEPGGTIHPGAFDATVALIACKYTPAARGYCAFAFENVAGNAEWRAELGGLLAPLRQIITIDPLDFAAPISPDTAQLNLRINRTNGTITGSFLHPDLGQTVKFSGAILQKPARAAGHFTGGNRTGTITLARNALFSGIDLNGLVATRSRPRVTIDLPIEGTRIFPPTQGSSPTVTITGHASGDPPARIEYQLARNGAVGPVTQVAGGSEWAIPLFLGTADAGDLTIFVKAIDADGDESRFVSRSFTYVVISNITVAVNSPAMGTVTDGFLGTTPRELGRHYTISAIPAPGHRFATWSGSITSTANPLVFSPTVFFLLRANFEPIP
jgi:Divergent InlB B-repeat domain